MGDVHANLPALRAVLEDAARIGAEAIYCVGDVVGRGPHPNEVVEELRSLEVPTVQGNWDEAVGMDREQTGAAWTTAEAEGEGNASMRWSSDRLSEENKAWLRQLPQTMRLTLAGRSIYLFHGSPIEQSEYLWSSRPSRVLARIASDEADDLFASATRTRPSTASLARRTSSHVGRSAAGPMAMRAPATRSSTSASRTSRSASGRSTTTTCRSSATWRPLDARLTFCASRPRSHPHLPTEVAPA